MIPDNVCSLVSCLHPGGFVVVEVPLVMGWNESASKPAFFIPGIRTSLPTGCIKRKHTNRGTQTYPPSATVFRGNSPVRACYMPFLHAGSHPHLLFIKRVEAEPPQICIFRHTNQQERSLAPLHLALDQDQPPEGLSRSRGKKNLVFFSKFAGKS